MHDSESRRRRQREEKEEEGEEVLMLSCWKIPGRTSFSARLDVQ
jgi:hypothetical protein